MFYRQAAGAARPLYSMNMMAGVPAFESWKRKGGGNIWHCFALSSLFILLKGVAGRHQGLRHVSVLPHRNIHSWRKQEIQLLSELDFFWTTDFEFFYFKIMGTRIRKANGKRDMQKLKYMAVMLTCVRSDILLHLHVQIKLSISFPVGSLELYPGSSSCSLRTQEELLMGLSPAKEAP